MGADQVAVFRPFIVELEDSAADGCDVEHCASFNVPGREAAWAQVVLPTVNFAYPFHEDPIARLERSGVAALPGQAVREWQPGLFATVSFDRATSREIARFVDGIFGVLLGCGDDYPVDGEIVRL